MYLYVNGDSHAAAAEAANAHAFAVDDHRYFYMGRAPHPANLAVSWPRRLSDTIKLTLKCDAEAASSNTRILRTTRRWIQEFPDAARDALMIIQWSTWERQEWLIDDVYYQITASGIDDVPQDHVTRYKEFVADINWPQVTAQAHQDIWDLHLELAGLGIRHVFFNGNNDFSAIGQEQRRDWGINYIDPYDPNMTYDRWLRNNGYQTVSPKSWHFGSDAHAAWASFMLQYIIKNDLVR
jgi:hypothetical protein